jgi:hypothetical protein
MDGLLCLDKEGYYFTDFKPANILYKYTDDNNIIR